MAVKLPSLQSLMKSGINPSTRDINLFLSFLLRTRKLQLLLHLFSQISSNSIQIDPHTHSLVARALLKARRFREAEQFISNSESYDFAPRKGLWDSLINGVCAVEGDPDRALSVLHECVRNRGVFPKPTTFRTLISSFCSERKMERAIEVLETMTDENRGYPVDNLVCSIMISGFSKIGKPELGVGFYRRVEKIHGFRPNLITYTAMVNALCRDGKIDEAGEMVWKMEEEGVVSDAVLYSNWICGYLRKGILLEGLRKHRLMMENGVVPDVISYTNIIDGLCKEGIVEKVIGFLCEMEKSGVKPSLVTYTAVTQGFCKRNKLEEALRVLRKVEKMGLGEDEFLYSVLIDGLCQKGDLDGAFSLLDEMEKKGIQVGKVTYNTVVNGLCKAGRTSEAVDISKGFVGDNFTYSTLLHGYIMEQDAMGVVRTKKILEEAGIQMDVVTSNVLIKALFMVGMAEDAYELFKEMPEMGLVPDLVTYSTMIDEYCKLGMIDKALKVFDEYRTTSLFSSAAVHNCIIRRLCKQHMGDMAVEVFQDLIQKNVFPDPATHKMLVRAKFKEGDGEGVLKFIHKIVHLEPEMLSLICNDAVAFLCTKGCLAAALDIYLLLRRRGLPITSKSYYVLLKSLHRSGNKHITAMILSDCMKVHGIFEPRIINALSLHLCKKNVGAARQFLSDMGSKKISVSVLTAVINAFKKEGRVLEAHNFLMEAVENGALIDVVVYSIVVDGLCKAGYLEKALDLCTSMRMKRVYPNIAVYNSIINGLCLQGCLIDAFRFFDSLESNNVVPTIITYATLIGALSREGFLQGANQLFETMVAKGISPNTRVYNLLINGHCSFGLIEEALKLLSDLEGTGLQPDSVTISAVISGYCQRGDIEGALGFLSEYRRKGFSPDFLGFMNLIKGLFSKGRMEETRSILRDMLQCAEVVELVNRAGEEFHVDSLVNLLSLACEQGRIREVIVVLSEVASMSFSSRVSHNVNRVTQLKELHESGSMETDMERMDSGSEDNSLMAMEVPETLYRGTTQYIIADTVNTNHRLYKKVHDDNDILDYEHLIGKSAFYDFDTCYSLIASLYSKGQMHKANNVVKAMLLNLEETC